MGTVAFADLNDDWVLGCMLELVAEEILSKMASILDKR